MSVANESESSNSSVLIERQTFQEQDLFNGLFSRTTWASRYQKGKTSLDLNEARGDGVLGRQSTEGTISSTN